MRLYRLYHFVMLCLALEFLSCTDFGRLFDAILLAEILHAHSVSLCYAVECVAFLYLVGLWFLGLCHLA